MIVNLRGTSGCGKSTLVRQVMDCYDEVLRVHIEKRKQPIGYECRRKSGRPLWVLGHYETACGGGDTVNGLDYIYELVKDAAGRDFDVLYEGLIIQSDNRRCIELSKEYPLLVLIIDEPIEVCLAGIQARRDARGDTRPLNPANTILKMKSIPGQQKGLLAGGVDVRLVNRVAAREACFAALQLAHLNAEC